MPIPGTAQPSPDKANLDEDYVPKLDPATTVLDDMSDQDVTDVALAATGNLDQAVEKYGAEAVYVSTVLESSWMALEAFPDLRDAFTNSELAQEGHAMCDEISNGATLDEIFLKGYEDSGVTEEQDSMFLFADFIWSSILAAPETLCPEHLDVVEDWEAAAH